LELGIPREKYEHLDLGKVYYLKILADNAKAAEIDAEKQKKIVIGFVSDVESLVKVDLKNSVIETIREISGNEINNNQNPPDLTDFLKNLKSGSYRILPLTPADRDVDPKRSKDKLSKVPKVKAVWYYSEDAEEFVLEIF